MITEPLILWGIGTTRTMRPHWLLHELDLPYETRAIGPRTGETRTPDYLQMNPKGKVPCLQHGESIITESLAIMKYVSDSYGELARDSWQQSDEGQAKYLEWASFILMELDATSLYVMRRHRDLFEIYGEAPAAVSSSAEYFSRMLLSIDKEIPVESGYIWGSEFSEIDIILVTCLDWAYFYEIEISENASRYRKRISERSGYQSAYKLNYGQ
jgi:glutathione S-transferase